MVTLVFGQQYLIFHYYQLYYFNRVKRFTEKTNLFIFSGILLSLILVKTRFSLLIFDVFFVVFFYIIVSLVKTFHKVLPYLIFYMGKKFLLLDSFQKSSKQLMLSFGYSENELFVFLPKYPFCSGRNPQGEESPYYFNKPTYFSDWWKKFKIF